MIFLHFGKLARNSFKLASAVIFTFTFSNAAFASIYSNPAQVLGTYTLDCAYWYVGGGIGVSHLYDSKVPGSQDSVDENGPGWSAYGGYRFNSLLGWELGYIQYYNSRESIGTGGHGSNIIAKTTHFATYTGGTLRYPLFNKFSAMGKLGVAYSYSLKEFTTGPSGSSGSVSPFVGLGFAYSVTKNADIVADWSLVEGNNYTGSSVLFSLGVTFGIV